jgi:chromosome segregation protein
MEDVIFLGSENRKPAGMAEVEMIFDNADRSLPVDQEEVSVGRRIYLNSSSEYLLGGKRTTRREIEKIFMDTGIGKTAYSIMEQGRMSEILSASPDDRRNLFDEAAGVSRFKAEREETLARLSDTEQNLLRLNDILKSKKEEMDHLERQAQKTRQYLKLKEYLDLHQMNLIYLNMSDLREKRRRLEEKIEGVIKRRNDLLAKIEEGETKSEEMEQDLQTKVEEMHNLDRLYHQELSRTQSLIDSIERLKIEEQDRQNRISGIDERKKNEEKLHREIQARLQASMQMELDLDAEIKALEESSRRIAEAINQRLAGIAEAASREEANSYEIQNIEKEQNALLDQLKAVIQELISELEMRKKELFDKEALRQNLKEAIVRRLNAGREAIDSLSSGEPDRIRAAIIQLSPEKILEDFQNYDRLEEDFRSIFFGKTGHLSRKEDLDAKMVDLSKRREFLIKENHHLFEKRKLDTVSLEKEKNRRVEMELQIRDFQVRRESSLEARENITVQIRESQERIAYYEEELKIVRTERERIAKEQATLKKELESIDKIKKGQIASIESLKKKIDRARADLITLKDRSRRDRESIEKFIPEISELERSAEHVSVQESNLQEELYNEFQISPGELTEKCSKRNIRRDTEESEFRRIKSEISTLGQFNALAIEELKRSEESYNHLKVQEADIQEARKNILNLLKQIDDRSNEMFLNTFQSIQNNFSEIFKALFGGGSAALTLTDLDQPMKCGIDIMVQPPGKKNRSITLLSGGEKNMTAIALMFATYLVRPSPFCFLDEIDAPLDESNVERFLKMLTGFSARSQFLVITHNKQTMMKSQAVYGVTQEEAGVSRIVSVRLGREERNAAV